MALTQLQLKGRKSKHPHQKALSTFSWQRSAESCRAELRWHAKLYESDPGPVTRQTVNFEVSPQVDLPDVSDVVPERELAFGLSNLFKGPNLGESRELQRLQIAQTWGVWLWIIAELVPTGDFLEPQFKSLLLGEYIVCCSHSIGLSRCHRLCLLLLSKQARSK